MSPASKTSIEFAEIAVNAANAAIIVVKLAVMLSELPGTSTPTQPFSAY